MEPLPVSGKGRLTARINGSATLTKIGALESRPGPFWILFFGLIIEQAQQLAEGRPVIRRQRGEEVLGRAPPRLAHVGADGQAAVGEVQADGAAVLRVDLAADKPRLLERVDHGGERARHDAKMVGEVRHPRRLFAAGDDAQGPLLRRSETERRQPVGLRAVKAPHLPEDQVRELDRVLIIHAPMLPGARLILSPGTIVSHALFELL